MKGSVSSPSCAKPQSRCAAASACESSAQAGGAERNVAVRPDGDPLRVDRRRIGLEVTELLLQLGIQPPLTTSLFWRLVKAEVLVGHT